MKFSKRTWKLDWEKNKHAPSRRDLLKKGIHGGVLFAVPNLLSQILMQRNAMAGSGFNNLYIAQLDLRGGYASHGQFIPAVASGSLSRNGLTTIGVTTNRLSAINSVDTQLGLPFLGTGTTTPNTAANAAQYTSKLMGGIVERAGTILSQVRASAVMIRSADDTDSNPLGLASALIAGGCRGNITNNFGMQNSESGIEQTQLMSAPRAAFARRVDDILNAARLNGLAHLPNSGVQALVNGMQALSANDLGRLNNLPSDRQIQELASNTVRQTSDYIIPPEGLDARIDPDAQTAFGITAATATTDQSAIIASLLSGLFRDYFGVASLRLLDSYDYHNTGVAATEPMDLAAGRIIGNCLRYASLKQKDFLLVVTSAGSVGGGTESATDPTAPRSWNGDRGINSAVLVFYHKASGSINQLKTQLGFFLPDGGTSASAGNPLDPIRGDVTRGAASVVANALMLAGRDNMIDVLFPGMFSRAEKDVLRLFG